MILFVANKKKQLMLLWTIKILSFQLLLAYGKSVVYQLPALLSEGTTLVINPFISLQLDQSQDLVNRGINAACINSTTGKKETKRIYTELESRRLKLLFVAPETLLKENDYEEKYFLDYLLNECNITHIVLDEAHGV